MLNVHIRICNSFFQEIYKYCFVRKTQRNQSGERQKIIQRYVYIIIACPINCTLYIDDLIDCFNFILQEIKWWSVNVCERTWQNAEH